MPKYDIKCSDGHYTEIQQTISEFRSEHVCPCGSLAKVVITRPPQFNMDWLDRQGFNESAGRYFSNRGEQREWMNRHDAYEIPPEDTAKAIKEHRETQEAKADLKESFAQHYDAKRRERIAERDIEHRQAYAPALEAAAHDLASGGISAATLLAELPTADRAPSMSDVRGVSEDGALVMAP